MERASDDGDGPLLGKGDLAVGPRATVGRPCHNTKRSGVTVGRGRETVPHREACGHL
jgi:hypothetical protein